MRRLLPAAVVAAVVALLVWVFLPQPPVVETARVTKGDLIVRIEAEGEARIREVVVVSAAIAGLLQRVTLHPGDDVTAGQAVAHIGPVAPYLLDARARAVAKASAAAAAAAVELARSQLVQAEAALDFATIDAARARANLAMRESEKQSADAMLDDGGAVSAMCCVEVKAPVAGRILRVVTEDEQVVQSGTPIIEIGDTHNLEIVAHVLSRDAVGISEGAEATITGWGGADLVATVQRVEPSATTRISALGIEEQRVEVLLTLRDAPPSTLGHGFRTIAQITVQEARNVPRVPIAALFRTGGDWAVYTVQDRRAVLRRLTLGARNEDYAEIVDGLTEGETVVLHPAAEMADGARIAP